MDYERYGENVKKARFCIVCGKARIDGKPMGVLDPAELEEQGYMVTHGILSIDCLEEQYPGSTSKSIEYQTCDNPLPCKPSKQ